VSLSPYQHFATEGWYGVPSTLIRYGDTQQVWTRLNMCSTQGDNNSREFRLPISLVCPRPKRLTLRRMKLFDDVWMLLTPRRKTLGTPRAAVRRRGKAGG
jgi:hypothetical protein